MKNKKGYVEEPVPILDPIQQLEDGSKNHYFCGIY